MKMILCTLLLINLGQLISAQTIDKTEFDTIDSIYKVVTYEVAVGEPDLSAVLDSALLIKYNASTKKDTLMKDPHFNTAMKRPEVLAKFDAPNIFIKVGRYVDVRKKGTWENFTVFVSFVPTQTVALDEKTYLKIVFADNTVKQYTNEAPSQVIGKDDVPSFYFTITKDDFLGTKDIKSAKIESGSFALEVQAGNDSRSRVKKMIGVLQKQKI